MNRVVIVGASLAGVHAARVLREEGFAGTITMVGDEPWMPYDRPPLSKQLLRGEIGREDVMLTTPAATLDAHWRLGTPAAQLDLAARMVILADGERVPFDGLVIATGATPRTMDGADMVGVHKLRTLDDALALEAELGAAPRKVVVVGGGFIGSEVASSCRARGSAVTVVEALAVPFSATLGAEVGGRLAGLHARAGVELRLGVGVRQFVGADRVEAVELSDGERLDADVVLVAIGVLPETAWLQGSGVPLQDGVMCDETCWVSAGVVAAGDVACWPNIHFDEIRRVEHWDNAVRQGGHAARRLLAESRGRSGEAYAPVPWVWSDQYDSKVHIVGSPDSVGEVHAVARDDGRPRLVAVYRRGDRVVGAVTINRARAVTRLRAMIAAHASWEDAVTLADEAR